MLLCTIFISRLLIEALIGKRCSFSNYNFRTNLRVLNYAENNNLEMPSIANFFLFVLQIMAPSTLIFLHPSYMMHPIMEAI